MELSEILAQPEGFTPPSATVKIKKVWEYKSGIGENGSWSFQTVEVEGGRLNLKNLAEFPKSREGQTVILRANQSKQHGLTGIKVNHREYNGKTYDQLVITNSCKWEWGPNQIGASAPSAPSATAYQAKPEMGIREYMDHLLSVAGLTNQVTDILGVRDEQGIQACFATLCIDAKNRGIVLPKALPALAEPPSQQGDPYEDAPPPDVDPNEFTEEDIPF